MSQKLKEYAESKYDFDAKSLEVIDEYVGNIRPRTEEELVQLDEAAF
jgi:hypothetical protein